MTDPMPSVAASLLRLAAARGLSLGVAESLTGGLVVASLVEVPGASEVLRGGIVAYATDLKASLLGVDEGLLEERGAVDPDVAIAMAQGVREATGADVGLATTGVAGPEPQDGKEPGLVYVAVATSSETRVNQLDLDGGDRRQVRDGAVLGVLALASDLVRGTD